jgi:hypothetical protein
VRNSRKKCTEDFNGKCYEWSTNETSATHSRPAGSGMRLCRTSISFSPYTLVLVPPTYHFAFHVLDLSPILRTYHFRLSWAQSGVELKITDILGCFRVRT